ncbi:RES family NAD+ phosphorylase [Paludibacterium yongneupense]|uniref:RES family NAD+ phosphorylase n=1 Tax=Paludibacterium yongneupense TaxID=400061 RepID=UPI001B7F9353
MTEDAPYPIDKMGAPPKQLATHGRANPTGIPYLYLGSHPATAIAEIRRKHPLSTVWISAIIQ